ncbi:MAG TPA: electron transport complex subunit RsxG, partial [Gammaproteobacteria bacterium]
LLWVNDGTRDRIAANEQATLLQRLNEIVPPESYNNSPQTDTVQVTAPAELGTTQAVTVYLFRRDGQPVAAVLTVIAPDGYSGNIKLLVGVYYDGRVAGVRAVSHKETPGLGDYIETGRSDWILGFNGRSLVSPSPGDWRVKPDGGVFDAFTGATITPRAVVRAVYKSLLYFEREKTNLFTTDRVES